MSPLLPHRRGALLALCLALLAALGGSLARAAASEAPTPSVLAAPVQDAGSLKQVVTSPALPNIVAALVAGGEGAHDIIIVSQDGGRSWEELASQPWTSYPLTDTSQFEVSLALTPAILPDQPFQLVVSTFDLDPTICDRAGPYDKLLALHRTSNLGLSWEGTSGDYGWLSLTPADPTRLYASYARPCVTDPNSPPTWEISVQRGDGNGRFWDALPLPMDPPGYRLYPSPVQADLLYARELGDPATAAWYRSEDAGATWTPLSVPTLDYRLAFDAQEAAWLYGATTTELLRSRDGGQSWEPLPAPLCDPGQIVDLFAHPTKSEWIYLYCGTSGGLRLYYSPDAGQTWAQIMGAPWGQILPNWSDPTRLFLLDYNNALWMSESDGQQWTPRIARWVLEPDLFFPLIAR